MPNNGRITLCPYYRDEKNLSISCEDTFRRFRWPAQKKKWLDKYCDKDWRLCPHAKELNRLYESYREGDEMGNKIKELQHKNKELERELRKTASMLGKVNKRDEEKSDKITALQKKNRFLEERYMQMSQQVNEAREQEKVICEEIQRWTHFYSGIICFLISEHAGGLVERDVLQEWMKNHDYELKADMEEGKDETGKDFTKIVRYRAEVSEIVHEDKRPATENEKTGRKKNRSSDERKS